MFCRLSLLEVTGVFNTNVSLFPKQPVDLTTSPELLDWFPKMYFYFILFYFIL